jgi:hypothetical protein
MRRALSLAAVSALAALALTASPAHADQTFTGSIASTDAPTHILQPDHATQGCAQAGGGSADLPVDTVDLTAQLAGNRRFVLTSPQAPTGDGMVLYVYRNGTCVAADYQPDDAQETAAGVVDVDNVPFAAGDRISVKIALFAAGTWTLQVLQPEPVKGAAKAAAAGNAKHFVKLPASISCTTHTATVTFTKKALRKADSAVIKANGATVKKLKALKHKKVVVRNLLATTTTLSVVVKPEHGKKVKLLGTYWAC